MPLIKKSKTLSRKAENICLWATKRNKLKKPSKKQKKYTKSSTQSVGALGEPTAISSRTAASKWLTSITR
jgi:hypothetical protein